MAKSKHSVKKSAAKRVQAAKPLPKKPSKAAAASKKPAPAKGKPAPLVKKPAPPLLVKKPPMPVKKPQAPAKISKPAKPAAPPAPTLLAVIAAVEAPGKFRREYRRWKEVLITLRHRLLQEGSHLEEEGLKALEQEVSVDHMADFGSDSSEQETTLQLIESNSISLRDVDDALKRIEARSYGLCEECEALIPPARLAVLPHARFCIACQSKREGMPA